MNVAQRNRNIEPYNESMATNNDHPLGNDSNVT